jgi:hypothetical protein
MIESGVASVDEVVFGFFLELGCWFCCCCISISMGSARETKSTKAHVRKYTMILLFLCFERKDTRYRSLSCNGTTVYLSSVSLSAKAAAPAPATATAQINH